MTSYGAQDMKAKPTEFSRFDFRTSSYSGENGNNCVEVARLTDVVGLRDSKVEFGSSHDVVLRVSLSAFAGLLTAVKDGRLSR
ncbi:MULTISPECIES: DUF397 domain-containing protein [Actinoalloteichus]|uniref:DUF397 family protein n=1 Tax=Actinoalloteichus fjordicus TaxID=1612552 RepID=A0AAC9L7K7_9PSEU|nr:MULTISPECIES: DUF397 domain-containing protein [Actinoalloteichus]APU12658.1 putative DUF397 family protein [Actinoalloteichus fjordicus]APU18628.1 putative DUF397 family protein [Actinoalloteichus sp. GBA129-24]